MSIIHMVACGMIEVDDRSADGQAFQRVRKEVRAELRIKGFRMTGTGGFYKLGKRIKSKGGGGGRTRYKVFFGGTLRNCCKAATKIITPSDHEEI